jgi:DNA-binding transcriptional regulator YiaG
MWSPRSAWCIRRVTTMNDNLKSSRLRLNLTQAEAAKLCGVDPNTWARWERGERQPGAPARKLIALLPMLAHELPAKAGKK